ncbi:hypothetical protein QTP88_027689 [Uroleucon formosanum]
MVVFILMPSINNTSNPLHNILQWNTRSLHARLIDIPHILSSNYISVALFSETWLLPSRRINIPGYRLIRDDRPDGYGGAAIAVKNSIKFRTLDIKSDLNRLVSSLNINLVSVKILLNNNSGLDIWSCYIPPHSNISQSTVNNIFNVMSNYCLFGGDVNSHHSCWGSNRYDHQGCLIHSAIEDLQLCILNNGSPTRLDRHPFPDTVVDISVSSPNLLLTSQWEVLGCPHGSDHYPIIIRLPHSQVPPDSLVLKVQQILKFNFNKADWALFSSLIETRIPPRFSEDPLEAYASFTDIVINAANLIIPKSKSSLHAKASPTWWNDNCTTKIKARSTAFRSFRTLKFAKLSAWRDFTATLNPSTPISTFWSTAKKFRQIISSTSSATNEEWFDNFCSKVAPDYVPMFNEIDHFQCANTRAHEEVHILTKPFLLVELLNAINSRRSPASGLDSISSILIKNLPERTISCLLDILNNLFLNLKVPVSWRQFKVIPIPKPNANLAAYRPIALSSILCKITEHMIKTRLDWWVEHLSVLPEKLFGFRKGRGTLE